MSSKKTSPKTLSKTLPLPPMFKGGKSPRFIKNKEESYPESLAREYKENPENFKTEPATGSSVYLPDHIVHNKLYRTIPGTGITHTLQILDPTEKKWVTVGENLTQDEYNKLTNKINRYDEITIAVEEYMDKIKREGKPITPEQLNQKIKEIHERIHKKYDEFLT